MQLPSCSARDGVPTTTQSFGTLERPGGTSPSSRIHGEVPSGRAGLRLRHDTARRRRIPCTTTQGVHVPPPRPRGIRGSAAGCKESQAFFRLRPHRHRALPPKLRNKGFSLAGYCLEPCFFHRFCASSCSRTVCVAANATHNRHVFQGCEEQGVPSRPQWPPGSPGHVV